MPYSYNRHAQSIRWFALKNKINERYNGNIGHFFPRGCVITVFFGENIGYEKTGSRPAVVVSSDTINRYSGNITVAPLTDESNKHGKPLLKTQYRVLKSKNPFLRLNSIIQCEDLRSISKARVGNVIGFIQAEDMVQINRRIKACFFAT